MKTLFTATLTLTGFLYIGLHAQTQAVPAPYITSEVKPLQITQRDDSKIELSPLQSCQVDAHQQKSAVLSLQIENAQLRAALADAQAKLAGPELTAEKDALLKERADLEKTLVTSLGGDVTKDTIDWSKTPVALVKKEK